MKLQIAAKLSLGICLIFTVVTVTPFFAAAEQGPQVKVGSYNIAAGVGEDGEFDIERTADTIRESGADIIGLQEVDVHWSERSDFVDQVEYLADELEMEAFFAPIYSIESDQPEDLPMEYGLAVLSKYPIVDANNHEIARLSTQDPSPEPTLTPGFPEVLISVDGANVWFYNTHLDYRGDPAVREMQVADMQEIMVDHNNTMLVGDLNARPDAQELGPLFETFTDVWPEVGEGEGFTFPVEDPDRRIDYILTAPEIKHHSADTLHSEASDHLMVTSTVTLNLASAENMKTLVQDYNAEGEFENDSVARSLWVHLTALEHYENIDANKKMIRHTEGLQDLLDHQFENGQISNSAYKVLDADAEALITQWQYSIESLPSSNTIEEVGTVKRNRNCSGPFNFGSCA